MRQGNLETFTRLTAAQQQAVQQLAAECTTFDAVAPFDEDNLLALKSPQMQRQHVLVMAPDQLQAYAQAWWQDGVCHVAMAVAPTCRKNGLATTLLASICAQAPSWQDAPAAGERHQPVTILGWAHGNLAAAQAFAQRQGAVAGRHLVKMHRPHGVLHPVPTPDGVELTACDPVRDAAELLAVNTAAFEGHPEQGRWSMDDLLRRFDEPWFSAEDVVLARDTTSGALLGFHWTKVVSRPAQRPSGEVYVIAVTPSAQGRKVGRLLLTQGLAHLADRGTDGVSLFVEADNGPAVSLYESLGFSTVEHHVVFKLMG